MNVILCETGEVVDTYSRYLSTRHWRSLKRRLVKERKGCEGCGKTEFLCVHHKTYERLGRELDDDVSLLCTRCHGLEHPPKEGSDIPIPSGASDIEGIKYTFTIADIANTIGQTYGRVRADYGLKLFDPSDLKSVLEYCRAYIGAPPHITEAISARIAKFAVRMAEAHVKSYTS